MARASRPRVVDSSDEADDSLPEIEVLLRQKARSKQQAVSETRENDVVPPKVDKTAKAPASVRRRKLGQIADNALLRSWTPDAETEPVAQASVDEKDRKPRRPRVELRSRKSRPVPTTPQEEDKEEDGFVSAQEEITITEEVSLVDDPSNSDDSDVSDYDSMDDFIVDDDDDDGSAVEVFPTRPPAKPRCPPVPPNKPARTVSNHTKDRKISGGQSESVHDKVDKKPNSIRLGTEKGAKGRRTGEKDLADTFSRLDLHDTLLAPSAEPAKSRSRKQTPPLTPPKPKPTLTSPTKLPRIPATPHRPSSDAFWSQEFIDDWNDEHSPRKQLFPSPTKASPVKKTPAPKAKLPSAREAKKAFEQSKHDLAASFLAALDKVITNGQLSELSASTGGIKLLWTNKLNTTAGRANWKRETLRATCTATNKVKVTYKHHASIELAEKVIDDEHRLLNVIAHEFCHLANFMVSGITNNPHGKEFKAWAAQCSQAFRDRGIEVTTKHSYEIDFKYVWECEGCGMEYKRHSKSVNPERHRCGGCKGLLKQIKPAPRGAAKTGDGVAKRGPTEYQLFMKEEMKRIREENPGSPQKDIMKMVAGRWAAKQGKGEVAAPVVVDLT